MYGGGLNHHQPLTVSKKLKLEFKQVMEQSILEWKKDDQTSDMWPFIIHSRKSVKAQGSVSNCLVSISDSIASKALLEHSKHQRVN